MNPEIERWKRLSTATVSDALDRLSIATQVLGLRAVSGQGVMVGRAFTIQMLPAVDGGGTAGDYIDDVTPGDVVVIDNGGRRDATVWGDLLSTAAHRRGIAGTVIHGVCRDVATSLRLGYPIFSRGKYMRTGKDRVQLGQLNAPISVGSVRVTPGDLIFGDLDGVIVVPRSREEEVFSHAQAIHEAEDHIREAIEKGARLDQARKEFGYFTLQRKIKRD
jgi:regulator of RNase E activity RraA